MSSELGEVTESLENELVLYYIIFSFVLIVYLYVICLKPG